jgi:hypothetical protein
MVQPEVKSVLLLTPQKKVVKTYTDGVLGLALDGVSATLYNLVSRWDMACMLVRVSFP